MGFLGNIFKKKDSQFYKEKGNKYLENKNYIDAMYAFEDGLKIVENLDDKNFFFKNIKECKKQIADKNINMAITYLEAGDKEQAYDFATNCLRFAESDEVINKAKELIDSLDQEELSEKLVIYEKDENIANEEIDFESYYDIIIDNYPDFIKEQLENNKQLQEILVQLNQGDLESAKKIMDIENGSATIYLKALFNSLSENYAESMKYYTLLVEMEKDNLDEERWIEIINAVDRAEVGEELIEHLLKKELTVNLTNALVTYLINKKRYEEAKDLAEVGLSIMNSDNFNLYLIGNTGLAYYMLKNYEKASEHLNTVRNTSASSGNYVFSPEYGIPLIISLEKTGKYDDAFEIVLHFMKAIENKEIKEIGTRLLDKSKREDLKKQFNLLV